MLSSVLKIFVGIVTEKVLKKLIVIGLTALGESTTNKVDDKVIKVVTDAINEEI